MLATLARHEGLMKVGFGVFATTLIPAGAQLYRLSRFSCGPSPTIRVSRPARDYPGLPDQIFRSRGKRP